MLLAAITFMVIGADLDAQIAQVKPSPTEDKWLHSIPWRLNLTQARIDAQDAGKPIVMWIMNGHPMGCT
jgi:hypothetical protein